MLETPAGKQTTQQQQQQQTMAENEILSVVTYNSRCLTLSLFDNEQLFAEYLFQKIGWSSNPQTS